MVRVFQLYGEATEVVIPPRRNNRGHVYGFVRFKNVKDPRLFAVRLDNIIFGAKKIHANMPRFQRNSVSHKNFTSHKKVYGAYGQQKKHTLQTQNKKVWKRVDLGKAEGDGKGMSYAAVMEGNRKGARAMEPKIVYYRKNNITELVYNVVEEEMAKYRKMYVGVVKTPGSTHYTQEWFSMQGVFSIKLTPMGANKGQMEEMEDRMIEALISDANEWIYEKFEDIRKWSEAEADDERLVWVRCHGVPVHAWNEEFFESLAHKFGVLVGLDDDTRKRSSMEVARLMI